MNFFKFDSPIFNFLTRICDVVILNILWVLCSIPLITMGAATTALYYSLFKINRECDTSITGMFFHSFRQNLKQGCGMTVIFVLSGLFLYGDIQACSMLESTFGSIVRAVLIVLLIFWGMMLSYAFPLLAQFHNTTINTLKNSFIMSIGNLGKTVIILLVNVIPLILMLNFTQLFILFIPIFLTFGITLIAFINSKILVGIFDEHISG